MLHYNRLGAIGLGTDANAKIAIAAARTAAAVPAQVQNLAAGTATTSAVPLTWDMVSTGGAIIDYTVQYKLSTDSTWTTFVKTASNFPNTTLTGLTQGSTYNIRVAGKRAAGMVRSQLL